ncbi:hypothetical protein L1987_57978 [Smallanthus sonchifolius]|uniref:Uncharacterized protein n=1 Tax=Smallanthus sonchifolius TaxID=185202 RepID=A0ACB9DF15_9ASTR|nr:hypothetical protein L1987_57978 [Smallanthus sonchifolius]
MAFMNYTISRVCIHPTYSFLVPYKSNTKQIFIFTSGSVAALSEKGTDGNLGEDDPRNASAASPSSRSQLDLLEQLTSTSPSGYGTDRNYGELTIREKLVELVGDRDDDFSMRLGKKMKVPKLLTVSQKRNIRRQSYLDEVSQRNDSTFFATIGAFVLLPPIIILGVAIATGYVQLFP